MVNVERPRGEKAKIERNKKIFKMKQEGFSLSQIAKEFELTPQGILYIIKNNK